MEKQQIKKSLLHGFTLVELIIVITILAILATLAFVSFQGYTQQSRDTHRLASLGSLEKAFSLYYTTVGSYPIPDNPTVLTLSGVEILQQGEIGKNISTLLQVSNAIDPLDKNYFLYSVSADKKRYQGLVYLEKPVSFFSSAFAGDYSQRYFKTFGDSIGILLNTDNSPFVSGTGVDINTASGEYKIVLDQKTSFSGTGKVLETLKNTTFGTHYKFQSVGEFMFEGKKYSMLWNKKAFPLTKSEKDTFTFQTACGEKQLSDISAFNNDQMRDFVNKSSQVLFDNFGKGEMGLNGLKNIDAYLRETQTLSADPGVSLIAKLHKYKYQVYTGTTCSWASSYTPENYPSYLTGYSVDESYMGSIGFTYFSTAPGGSHQGNHTIFGPLYGIDIRPKVYKNFTNVSASMSMINDYVSSACGSWNTSMGGGNFPYGYLEAYTSKDTIFTKPSIEYGLRNDSYYTSAQGKTGYQIEYGNDNAVFGARLIMCNN